MRLIFIFSTVQIQFGNLTTKIEDTRMDLLKPILNNENHNRVWYGGVYMNCLLQHIRPAI